MREHTPTELREIEDCQIGISVLRHYKAEMMDIAMRRNSQPLEALRFLFDEAIYDLRGEVKSIEDLPSEEVLDEASWVPDAQLRFELGSVA